MKKILNFTPHVLNIYAEDKATLLQTIPSQKDDQGKPVFVRVTQQYEDAGNVNSVPVVRSTFGGVTGLPEPQANTYLIVSLLVAQTLPQRSDLLVPDTNVGAVRSDQGQIIGTTRFLSI